MAWISRDRNGSVYVTEDKPERRDNYFNVPRCKGQRLESYLLAIIEKYVTPIPKWEDEPKEIK